MLAGSGAVASQAGHLLVYQLQYGSGALAVQSEGVHAYFPALLKTGFGAGALVTLAALLIIGASRLVAVRPGTRITGGPSYLSLLASLFTIQATCFVVQESVESLVAGTPVSAGHLILLASLGQLPIAAVGALALMWLKARVETALTTLRQVAASRVTVHVSIAVVPALLVPAPQLALAGICPTAYVKRGPPPALLSH
jgi:hypothetical protein